MNSDPEVGGPSAQDRQLVYAQMRLNEQQSQNIENMVLESGRRKVGSAALMNVRVRHNSIKNGTARVVESHTCELVFAYELELDPGVLGYYTQVPCRQIRRVTSSGRQHVSTAHIDFLVLRHDGVELVECKQESWLEKQNISASTLWLKQETGWTYAPYANWAAEHGLKFSIWTPPCPPGIYLRNLEAGYAVLNDQLDSYERGATESALKRISIKPMSITQLVDSIPGFNERMAFWMLANAKAFGPWKSTPIDQGDRFLLYANQAQAREADTVHLKNFVDAHAQPGIQDPLLLASAKSLVKARCRLRRLASIEAGESPNTKRMRQLAKRVSQALAQGQSALSACLPNYCNSGNHTSRLLPEQTQAVENVIASHWQTGKVQRVRNLYYVFEQECARLGVEPFGRSRLDARRRGQSPNRHALATGGFRAYHAVRSSTDPRFRSMTPLGYGQVLHIDSSDLDVRCAPDVINHFPDAKAKFYIGIDGATSDTMAHSLIFGSARTDGLAILMREYVKRHGFLPQMIHVDRGSENTSHWIDEFCDGKISLRHSPTAGSPWNGIAENAIKQVNEQVAHQMIGSTAPDQKGRKVDGRFKSRNHAKTGFIDILKHFADFVYGDLPNTPGADGQSPVEKKETMVATYGNMGTPCEWNDDFVIRTSIKVKCKGKPTAKRGIRTADGYFNSDELLMALRGALPEQVRSDCCYPEVLYVHIAGRWLKAFHRKVLSMSLHSDDEKLFELLYAPSCRKESRKRKDSLSRGRHTRLALAEVARPGIEHLAPMLPMEEIDLTASVDMAFAAASLEPMWKDLQPFPETEDY